MEARWQLLLIRLLEADRSHSSTPPDRLKAEVPPKKKRGCLSSLISFIHSFLSDGAICSLLLQALYMFSYALLHTHCQIGALVHCTRGESGSLKEVYMTLCETHSEARKRPQCGFNREKNKVASFCTGRDHDSLWVTWVNSNLSIH